MLGMLGDNIHVILGMLGDDHLVDANKVSRNNLLPNVLTKFYNLK